MNRRQFNQALVGDLLGGCLSLRRGALADEDSDVKQLGRELQSYLSVMTYPEDPTTPPTYLLIQESALRGLVRCTECGESVNMGGFVVKSRNTGETLEMDYLGVHAMVEHGTSQYHYDVSTEDLEEPQDKMIGVQMLRRILHDEKPGL
ncbi:MAG: hypothetical protein HY319_20395 [Armatimonadetes bacterium]|nr:hypothetical protein [Armatimonadota bacterium]